ncbi:MAG: ABC transporter substrate-binding protein, partial [Prevotella sp.]|nr:ABC transporter substrate-binding protein [Prevotella sp.]
MFTQFADGDTLNFKYAQNICIVKHRDFSEVTLSDPWNKGVILAKYLLSDKPEAIPDAAKEGCVVVKTPIKKALIATAVHCALYEQLGKTAAVAGVCDANYINLDYISKGLKDKKIADCGSAMQPNVERVVALSPDVIMLSPYQTTTDYGKVAQLGIPIIQLSDYMETTPLGRAEWILFYGMLVGEEEKAAKLFADVDKKYNEYKEIAARQPNKKAVLMDKMLQATWFLPGGASTIGQMLHDANCRYAYSDTEQSGSI